MPCLARASSTIVLTLAALAPGCAVDEDDDVLPRPVGTSDRQIVGPEGGTLDLLDGAQVVIPPGALDREIELGLSTTTIDHIPAEVGVLSPTYHLSPDWITLARPGRVTLPLLGEPGPDARLWVGREGAGSWLQRPMVVDGSSAVAEVRTGGLLGVLASPLAFALPCDRTTPPEPSPEPGASWPLDCATVSLACEQGHVDPLCDEQGLGIACVCGDRHPPYAPLSIEELLGSCASDDPCRVGCTTVQLAAGCGREEVVLVDLASLVPGSILMDGGSGRIDDTTTVTLDVATCRLAIATDDGCATTAHLDLLDRSCTWGEGHAADGSCAATCDVPCRVF